MFHVPMGRFKLELIYYFTYFPPSSHPTVVCFFPVGLSSLIRHFQQVLWALNCPSQDTEETSTPRPVENIVLTTKGLQERNTTVGWDDGGIMGKIIN